MPFDSAPADTRPITRLIEKLRGPEPEDWNFDNRCKCAQPIASALGIDVHELVGGVRNVGIIFDVYGWPRGKLSVATAQSIRPRHVAAALEHYRDTGEALSPFTFVQSGG